MVVIAGIVVIGATVGAIVIAASVIVQIYVYGPHEYFKTKGTASFLHLHSRLPLLPFFISFIRSLLLYRLLLCGGGEDPMNFLSDDGLLLSVLCENPFSPIYEGPRGERYSFIPVLLDLSSSWQKLSMSLTHTPNDLQALPSTYLSMVMS